MPLIKKHYVCPKCGNEDFASEKLPAGGNLVSRLFENSNKRFITVSCTVCGYTEVYRNESTGASILDFLVSG